MELELVIGEDVVRQQAEEDVQQSDQRRRLQHGETDEVLYSLHDDLNIRDKERTVSQKRHSAHHDDRSVEVHQNLVEQVDAADLAVLFLVQECTLHPANRIRVVAVLEELTDPDKHNHEEVHLLEAIRPLNQLPDVSHELTKGH